MLNSISFMGSGKLLIKPAKQLENKASEFISEGTLALGDAAKAVAEKAKNSAEEINEAYRANHAPFTVPKHDIEKEQELFGDAYNAAHGKVNK